MCSASFITSTNVVAASTAMQRVLAASSELRASRAPLLLVGEPGVGKELVARTLHRLSERAGPFLSLNCAAAADDELVERRELREVVSGGTLFLDEVGELSRELQGRILALLESPDSPARVVATTARDLRAEARAGLFDSALYERLAATTLTIPPLRERSADLEPLALAFARRGGVVTLPPEVLAKLRAHHWPGNVRELRDVVLGYVARGELQLESSVKVDLQRSYVEQRDEVGDRFTRTYLSELLTQAGGNLSRAARMAKLDRSYLSRLLARAGLGPRSVPRDA